jgi:hypothetical protein
MFLRGDIVRMKKSYLGMPHPNYDRSLEEGDTFIVEIADVKTVGYKCKLGQTCWIDAENCEYKAKGDMEDCLKFLKRTKRQPNYLAPQKWAWGLLSERGSYSRPPIHRAEFLPQYIFKHLPNVPLQEVIGGMVFRYASSQEEAFKNACEAWLKMTPSQQLFLNSVNYLEEIYP